MTAYAPPLDPPALDADISEFYELSYQLSLVARRQMQAALAVYNLTPPQYAVMKTIDSCQNSITVTALAEATHQVMPTITGILNRLEERALVIRRRSPTDRRTLLVSVTPTGAAVLSEFSQTIRVGVKSLLSEISPADRQHLLRAIRTLKNKLETSLTSIAKEDLSVD
jgi:DNA-binding MarR family transcriptional regulator